MAFKKKTGGRKAGVPNKVPAYIKDMLRQALEDEGGKEYFRKLSREEPSSFASLVGKLIPSEINIDANVKQRIMMETIIVDGNELDLGL